MLEVLGEKVHDLETLNTTLKAYEAAAATLQKELVDYTVYKAMWKKFSLFSYHNPYIF